jgi:hypothetical protein
LFDFPFFYFFPKQPGKGARSTQEKGGMIVGNNRRLADGGRDTAGTVWRVV